MNEAATENNSSLCANIDKFRFFPTSEGIRLELSVHFKEKLLVCNTVRVNGTELCCTTNKDNSQPLDSIRLEFVVPYELMQDVNNFPSILVESNGSSQFVDFVKPRELKNKMKRLQNNKVCMIKTKNNRFCIEYRDMNVTDRRVEEFKLYLAYMLHLLTPFFRPVIMYEKNCRGYEESASVLFEELMRNGYKGIYYILEGGSPAKHIVRKYSFMHYYLLFACRTVISTETLAHALDKYCSSRIFSRMFLRGNKNYVFLQHGVTYMISLASEQRAFYKKRESKGIQRVVVSSQKEADQFINCTSYTAEDMYITGFAKFDRCIKYDYADKIVIMLTWRPWEANLPMEETSYYRMLVKIADSIPAKYKDKTVIIPHPLFKDKESDLWSSDIFAKTYDEILREAAVLVTDYSSISYDAFYRGSNIIFCWEELSECIKHYGPSAELLLKENEAFGIVNYDSNISDALDELYLKEQKKEYVENYRSIVQYHDNRNTERIVHLLERDKLIHK